MKRGLITVARTAMALVLACTSLPVPVLHAAPQIVSPNGAPMSIDVGKGLIVRLDRPCASVFVSDPTIADVQLKSPTILYVMGKSAGETTIYAVDQGDAVLLNSRIDVKQDVDRLQREIQAMAPGTPIRAKAVDDSIVLEGLAKSAAEGDDIRKIAARYVATPAQLVNKMTLDTPNQINLSVRIAEVNRTVLKQFGINWENVAQNSTTSFGLVSAGTTVINQAAGTGKVIPLLPGQSATAANALGFNTQNTSLIGNATNNNFFGGYKNGQFNINAMVDALAQQGLITVLAEPNLTTISGQKASFLAGGEFPVPVPQAGSGVGASITIDWKQFGVSLNFTPTILGNGRIALHVAPEVSQLAPQQGVTIQGVTVPGITTRRADTTVELGSGQSFAIAGLLQNQTQQQLQAYPWIGDIPIVGALFRSTAFQRGETELVIIVTPYLVAPVSSAAALKTPADGFFAPSDSERVVGGALNAKRPTRDDAKPADDAVAVKPAREADAVPAPREPVAPVAVLPQPETAPASIAAATVVPMSPASTAPMPITAPKAAAILVPRGSAAAHGFEID
jgi:pilus assembly protein CpaC